MTADVPAEVGAGPPIERALAATEPAPDQRQVSLFGRGLLYVVVYSLQTIAAVVVSPVVVHLMGPYEFGRLASAIALLQLLTVFAILGLDQALVLQRAEDHDERTARGLLVVSFGVTILVTLAAYLTGPLWASAMGFGSFSPLLIITLLWTLASACVQVMLALLVAQDRLKVFTVVSALAAVGGQVLGIALILVGHRTAAVYAFGGVVSQFIALGIGLVVTRPRPGGLGDLAVARKAFSLGLPLAVTGLAAYVLNAGDRIIIQRLLGAEQVGRYQVAYTVGYVVVLLLTFTSQAWTPRFAAIRDTGERLALAGRSRDEIYRLLAPMLLGITLAAPLALRIVAPASFEPGSLAVVVYLVALSAVPVAASGASARELFTLRRGKALALGTVVAAVVNIALNLVLVPRIGIAGSAAATGLAFVVQALLQFLALPSHPRWPRTRAALWAVLAVSALVSAASLLLPQTLPWNLVRVGVGLACLPWFLRRLVVARRGSAPSWPSPMRRLVRRRRSDVVEG